MKYLVCVLDDEHYSSPDFEVHNTLEEAKKACYDWCAEYCKGWCAIDDWNKPYEIEPFNEIEMRQTVDDTEGVFLVTEVKEVNGDYALVEHHAYDGVDFEVKCCGTYEECEEKRKEWVKNCQYEFDTEDEDDTYDTGVEWIHISLVKLKED